MAVYKIKRFNQVANSEINSKQPTAKELQIEQMKLQRQLLLTQRARDKASQQERDSKMRQQIQNQKLEQKRDDENDKKIIQSQKLSNQKQRDSIDSMPPSLVKNRTKPSNTVSVNK